MSHNKLVAIVTGANRGIGYELVKQLAVNGFTAILTSRDPEKGQTAAHTLKQSGLDATYVRMDVDDQESVHKAAYTVEEAFGRIDVLINNAGVYLDGNEKLLESNPAILEKTMSTNFFGAYHVIRSFMPLMEKRGYGRIINLSSEYGMMEEMSERGVGAYKISKLALNGLTRLIAAEVQVDIKINAVCPGWVSTEMGGPAAPVTPKQAVESILWLATIGSDGPQGGFFRNGKPINW